MTHVLLVNPNTSVSTTKLMLESARQAAPSGMQISDATARQGASLIVDPEGLAIAAAAVADLMPELSGDGIIVAAFGDPGVDVLRRALRVPVMGIGEAAMREAQAGGRRFSIVTTTPQLEASIRSHAAALGYAENLARIRTTVGDPIHLTADVQRLEAELLALVECTVAEDGAEAVIIGGGPLARAARAIAHQVHVPIIEPVPAAVTWMARRLETGA
jgi:allantoin racemase